MFTKIMKWASIVALGVALMWHPAAGYALALQFVVCIAAIMVVAQSLKVGKAGVAILFIAVAALFNPVVPPTLSRGMFLGAGGVSLALFLLSVVTFRQQPQLSVASITDRTPGSESL